jgi:hypothetical protein
MTIGCGDYIVCRADRTGVFIGTFSSRNGREVELLDARRVHYWDGAASLSELSQKGVAHPENCRFPVAVPYVLILDAIELIPVSTEAENILKAVPCWSKFDEE